MNIIEFNGEAVLETKELAKLYCRAPHELTIAFFQNINRFKEGEHYYLLDNQFQDFEEFINDHLDEELTKQKAIYLWTEHGLYEHASLMNCIKAWHSYCQFIYFVLTQSEEVKQAIQVLQKAEDMITREKFLYFLTKELFTI
ncbi:ORF6N domain-containing protein [Ureibacillus sp. GCM10028918]|uniref:ORF6N domain-containing protein n=1 Tax=Ureibacillus sp. GCM10028918 TaxID=3273429 RepID=UPI0036F44547